MVRLYLFLSFLGLCFCEIGIASDSKDSCSPSLFSRLFLKSKNRTGTKPKTQIASPEPVAALPAKNPIFTYDHSTKRYMWKKLEITDVPGLELPSFPSTEFGKNLAPVKDVLRNHIAKQNSITDLQVALRNIGIETTLAKGIHRDEYLVARDYFGFGLDLIVDPFFSNRIESVLYPNIVQEKYFVGSIVQLEMLQHVLTTITNAVDLPAEGPT